MAISKKVKNALNGASWVRRMFEEGEELKRLYGEENIFDFSLGNPNLEPPASLKKALKALAGEAIAKTLDVKTVTKIVGDKVRDIFSADQMGILLFEPQTKLIHVLYGYDKAHD